MNTLLELAASGKLRLDPYLVWAWLTSFRDYLNPHDKQTIAVAIECRKNVRELADSIKKLGLVGVTLNPLYTDKSVIHPSICKFCTATVALSDLGPLALNDLLPLLLLVERLELGTAVNTMPGSITPVSIPSNRIPTVVIGIIDDFVAFAHPYFGSKASGFTESRVSYVWSQDPIKPDAVDPSFWYAAKGLSYGFELNTFTIPGGHGVPKLFDLQRAYPAAMSSSSHGTSVADLAAGYRQSSAWTLDQPSVIAVHFPRRTVADTSGGALSVQALDGVRYILWRAGANASVVVNLSYGTMAGPHDGTSILEQALDELIYKRGGKLAVVLPAGNAYDARGHAEVKLTTDPSDTELNWFMPPDSETPAFLEIWVPKEAASCVTIEVKDPQGRKASIANAPGVATADGAGPSTSSFGVVYLNEVANGNKASMILVAVAPTACKRPGRVLANHGIWTVKLSLAGTSEVGVIHAWIERDDSLHGQPRRGRQSYFIDKDYEMPRRTYKQPSDKTNAVVKRTGSFNTIANGKNTITVGGYVGGIKCLADYSGATTNPPLSSLGPDVLARAEESRTLHGEATIGNGAISRSRINGTSAAAPHVTRLIAEWFLDPALSPKGRLPPAKIRRKLKQVAVNPRPLNPDAARDGVGLIDEPLP
jgi:Subtilase family